MDELVQASMIVTMSPVQALLLLLGAPPGLKMPAYDLVQAGMIVTMSLVQALLLLLGTPPGLKMPTIVTMSLVQAHASSTLSKSPLLDPGKKTKEATALTSPASFLFPVPLSSPNTLLMPKVVGPFSKVSKIVVPC
jgi:hypothetical protein